ncbi:hypothetical protein GCM10009120_51050 [Sphingobacterium siyangense subsp. cladoniae]
MTNAQFTYHKVKLTTWLLTVTLLFSIFTFSGYVGNNKPRHQQAPQTELLISINHKPCRQAFSYKKVFELIRTNEFSISSYKSWTNTLLTYNILTKVKIDSISKQFRFHMFAECFLSVKTIPQGSEEDILQLV